MHAVDSDITLRELLITPRNNPTAPPRRARHYHYHAWPDRSVPTQALSLRRLSRKLADRISASHAPGAADADGPPVVHCSAGEACMLTQAAALPAPVWAVLQRVCRAQAAAQYSDRLCLEGPVA